MIGSEYIKINFGRGRKSGLGFSLQQCLHSLLSSRLRAKEALSCGLRVRVGHVIKNVDVPNPRHAVA